MGSIPNGSAPLQACARLIFILRYRAAPGRRKFPSLALSSRTPLLPLGPFLPGWLGAPAAGPRFQGRGGAGGGVQTRAFRPYRESAGGRWGSL